MGGEEMTVQKLTADWRRRTGTSIEAAAEAAGVSHMTWRRAERGQSINRSSERSIRAVVEGDADVSATVWLGVADAADRAKLHPKTVLRALQAKQLRGYQRGANATWRIAQADLDAWVRGEMSPRPQRSTKARKVEPREATTPARMDTIDDLIAAVARMPLADLERLRDIVATAIAVRSSDED